MDRREVDSYWMRKALKYGEKWEGVPLPNPGVVALVVKEGKMISWAQHRVYGESHAEKIALEKAGEAAKKATLYVTLEPCSHYGKTPPCTESIIRSGIKRVVIGASDPNPEVSGKGVEQLKKAGIEILSGIEKESCEKLHRKYFFYRTKKKPIVALKWAMTADGKIADWKKRSFYITGEKARKEAHLLRLQFNALGVGIGTVLCDDPLLLPRMGFEKQWEWKKRYVRVVFDSYGKIPVTSRLVATAHLFPLWIFCSYLSSKKKEALESKGARCFFVKKKRGKLDLQEVMEVLKAEEIAALLIEGGANLAGSFFQENLFEEVHVFLASKLLGGSGSLSPLESKGVNLLRAKRMSLEKVKRLDSDLYLYFSLQEK